VLIFVGLKMFAARSVDIPIGVSLAVIVLILGVAARASSSRAFRLSRGCPSA
jgi:hypothetical protein